MASETGLGEFEETWRRIVAAQGEQFHQKTGKPFTYVVRGAAVMPETTNRQIPRAHFERASGRRPLDGPGRLQDLQGPSYLYAILTDPRVGAAHGSGSGVGSPPVAMSAVAPSFDPSVLDATDLPLGWAVDPASLAAHGFLPLGLNLEGTVDVNGGHGTNWAASESAVLRTQLRADEAALILRWNLTVDGWNRI